MRKYDVSKAVSALGARGLVPVHRNKTALRSDTGTPKTQVPYSARVQCRDLVPG